MGDCKVNERTLPNDTLDQSVAFNSFGRYIRVLAASNFIQSNVKYNKDPGFGITINWAAKTANIITTWNYNVNNVPIAATSETSFNLTWPNQNWGTSHFVLQPDNSLVENTSKWTPAPPNVIQSNVRYVKDNGFVLIINWPAKTASVIGPPNWNYNPTNFGISAVSETSFKITWPSQPAWGTGTFVLQGNGSLLENGSMPWLPATGVNTLSDGHLNISQVAVYDLNGNNIALGKSVSTTAGTYPGSAAASIVIDGTTTPRGWPNIWHSEGIKDGYLQVDLGSVQMIKSVRIIARNDEWGRLRSPGTRIRVLQNTTDPIVTGTCLTSDAKAAADVAAIKAAANAAAKATANAAKAATNAKTGVPKPLINALKASAVSARNTINSTKLKANMSKLVNSVLQLGGSKKKVTRKKKIVRKKRKSGRKTRHRR